MVSALEDKIQAGYIHLVCLDSVDSESWYAKDRPPQDRIHRHLQYESYVLDEVLPRTKGRPVAAGTSFGALHSVLLALRHPDRLAGFVALSGAYDTSRWLDGYSEDGAYYINPLAFLPGLRDRAYLDPLQAMEKKVIATGENDPNALESVRVGELLQEKGVGPTLDVWRGWAHDWPYWKEMMRRYV
jgi:esterase/lipase superfamily enzyme